MSDFEFLCEQEAKKVEELSRAGVVQFKWNGERYGDRDEVAAAIATHVREQLAPVRRGVPIIVRGGQVPKVLDWKPNYYRSRAVGRFFGNVLLRILGAVLCAVVAVAFEFVLLHLLVRFSPELPTPGAVWVVIPMACLVVGFQIGPNLVPALLQWTTKAFRTRSER